MNNLQQIYNKPKLTSTPNNSYNYFKQNDNDAYINQAKVLDRYNTPITLLKQNPVYRDDLSQITANNRIQRELINDYLQNQKDRYVNKDDPILHYNPIIEYNNNGGKISNTTIRFEAHDLNIDSRYRRKEPRITFNGNTRTLNNNCLSLTKNSSLLYIQDYNHPYKINDKIILKGITPFKNYIDANNLRFNNNSKEINLDIIINNDDIDIFPNNSDDCYLEITNYTNLDVYSKNVNYVGNIPITIINDEHKFNFTKENNIIHITFNLPFKYIENSKFPLSKISRTFNISFYFYGNIPIYYLNAYYPTNNYAKNNYHIIKKIDNKGYYVDLGIISDKDLIFGKNISVRKIFEFEKGYEEPNDYVIELTQSYKNIVQVEMLSSEFPCMENTIFKNKSIKTAIIQGYNSNNEEITFIQNNKFYWQNEDDGNFTYEIEIDPGKYNINELCKEIENKVYNIKRNYYNDDLLYNNHNVIKVNFDLSKDLIIFNSYNEYYFNNDNRYKIITEEEYNNLSDDDKLNVIISYDNIYYYKSIYGNFMIIELDYDDEDIIIINDKEYNIKNIKTLDNNNSLYVCEYVDNNNNIFYTKNKFRLLFNKNDTFGNILGFADVGKDTSITQYAYEITNKMLYYPSLGYELSNDDINIGNSINLLGHSYIIMICEEFPVMDNIIGINKNKAFQKIQLNGISNVVNGTSFGSYTSGSFVYNTFIRNMSKIYYVPIHEVSKLTFKFYSPNGELYDFNGIDHSFTLRITTLENIPEHTNINAQTSNYI